MLKITHCKLNSNTDFQKNNNTMAQFMSTKSVTFLQDNKNK